VAENRLVLQKTFTELLRASRTVSACRIWSQKIGSELQRGMPWLQRLINYHAYFNGPLSPLPTSTRLEEHSNSKKLRISAAVRVSKQKQHLGAQQAVSARATSWSSRRILQRSGADSADDGQIFQPASTTDPSGTHSMSAFGVTPSGINAPENSWQPTTSLS